MRILEWVHGNFQNAFLSGHRVGVRILECTHGKFQNGDHEALERCELYWIYGDHEALERCEQCGTAGEVELQESNRSRHRVVEGEVQCCFAARCCMPGLYSCTRGKRWQP